jgi:MFS family permease
MGLGRIAEQGELPGGASAWRVMFVVGTVPALLAVVIRRRLKEPERWQAIAGGTGAARDERRGSYAELFGDPRWRKNVIVGVLLASPGIIGLWGIGFFSYDLIASILRHRFEAEGLDSEVIIGKVAFWTGITSIMQNIGGFLGVYAYSRVTGVIGRKPAFAIAFILATLSTAYVFWYIDDSAIEIGGRVIFTDVFWMIPIMGFCQLALFGGYAIYFPELFPTRLRSTGTSFCYNVGRYVAAVGPTTLGLLASQVYQHQAEPLRYAGVTMCSVFLLGLLVLPFAPETRDKPLPE